MSERAANTVIYWRNQLDAAEKREERWRKDAKEALEIYEAEILPQNSFNILYSNTETLLPGVYSTIPRPEVRRRYLDEDPLGKAVSETIERGLAYALDSPDRAYTSFDDLFEAAVIGALVPGRGISRFRYEATYEEVPVLPSAGTREEPQDQSDATPSERKLLQEPQPTELAEPLVERRVVYETVCPMNWPHDRFLQGFARRWSDVPWIAYEHRMTKDDLEFNFGPAIAEKIPVEPEIKESARRDEVERHTGEDTATVWEIWHKTRREILFICTAYSEGPLKKKGTRSAVIKDPYGLPGFFDCPQPLTFMVRNTNLVPVTLYRMYKEQAKELNRVTMRINKVMEAIKVRGFYNGQIHELGNLLDKPENTLIPAQNVLALMETLDKHIWLVPIEKFISVLQQLYIQRQQIKQTIYEITGISDILRGTSVASETATAQNIKNQWGTLRLKRMQKQVQEYIRECMRITSALQANHLSQATWQAMTQMPFVTVEQKQKAQVALQQMQMQLVGAPPEAQQQAQARMAPLQQTLQTLDWSQVLGVMKDELSRGYRIDIETNSTVDPDATEDKQNITDILTALSQAMQVFGPMAEKGALPLGVIKSLLKVVSRRFQFGPEIEDELNKMPEQIQQGGSPEELAKLQKTIADMQAKLKEQQIQHNAENEQVKQEVAMEGEKASHKQEMEHKEFLFEIETMLEQHLMDVNKALMQAGTKAEVSAVRQEGKQQKMAAKQQGIKTPPAPGPDPAVAQTIAAIQASNEQLVGAVTRMVEAFSARRQPRNVGRGPDGRLTVMNAPPSVQ